jgi:hypothetical protein
MNSEQLSHKQKVYEAVAGFVGSRKQGKMRKLPCRCLTGAHSSILARVSTLSKRLGADKRQDIRPGGYAFAISGTFETINRRSPSQVFSRVI